MYSSIDLLRRLLNIPAVRQNTEPLFSWLEIRISFPRLFVEKTPETIDEAHFI